MKKMTMPQGSGASMRRKLYSALSMLLVSGIMMVTSSYAWFVMSTAPEVKGIQTQVGANGALEIALLDQKSWNDLNLLDMGDIDENATTEQNTVAANLTWGNLVNLESATYGLSNIILQPSRLNIKQSGIEGTDDYTILGTLLKTPVYGEDGRVKKLEEKAVASIYKAEDKAFNETGYGVRAIGTAANMSTFQLGMNAARTQISNFTTSARSAASTALNTHGGNMASIAVAYALQGKEDGYTKQDIENIKALAVDMQAAVDQIENGMRQVYAGYITTAASGITAETYQAALEEINTLTLAELDAKYPAITTEYDITGFITKLSGMQGNITTALDSCDKKLDSGATSFTWNEISSIITPLVDINGITVGGKNVTQLKNELKKPDGSINFNAALDLLRGGGLTITVATGSGLLSEIADFVGDYTATVAVKDVTVGGTHLDSVDVGMETKTTFNPPILTACSNKLAAQALTEATGSSAITDYYGYAIDLAFRTNATNSSLQLQTEPANRIYNDGSSQNEALQGGGSYMTFKTEAGLSATKMVKLMNGVRVVFMDKSQNVLKLAKLDTTLGKNNYDQFTKDQTDDNYAYLNAFPSETATTYQKSDIISKAEYNNLPATGTVEFKTAEDGTNTVTAKLYLYEFSMTTKPNADGTTHQTGGITIGNKITSTAITALEADTPMIVTALVYLDGSVVNNSMVAASALQSMTGTLNLQFSSSAQLMPAQNTALKDGKNNNTSGG